MFARLQQPRCRRRRAPVHPPHTQPVRRAPSRNPLSQPPADSTPQCAGSAESFARAGAACSGTQNITLGADAETISDGLHAYADNAFCRWAVTAAGSISLFVHSFETQEDADTVTVYAGEDASQPPLYTLSGVLGPTLLATNASSVTIEFTSDWNRRFAGFVIELRTVQPGGTWAPSRAPSDAPAWTAGSGVLRPSLLPWAA